MFAHIHSHLTSNNVIENTQRSLFPFRIKQGSYNRMNKFPRLIGIFFSCAFVCLLLLQHAIAQPKVDPRYPIDRKDNVYPVKQFDEFIERFNFDKRTPLLKHLSKECPNCPLDRQNIILSLFNAEKVWNTSLVDSFVSSVTRNSGELIQFNDRDWFIELTCIFDYQGNELRGYLYLENRYVPEHDASRWEISGVRIPGLPVKSGILQENPSDNHSKIIPPTNHETRFAGLGRTLKDKKNLANYFTRRDWNKELVNFYHAIKSGKLCLDGVTQMQYHLLQIDNWIVTLQDFSRNLPNSGLLIADIKPASKAEKVAYLRERLRIL